MSTKENLFLYISLCYYKTNIKLFSVLIYSYINTRGNWENSKLCENTPPSGRRLPTQFLVFPISTRIDITVYQHGKCFIFVKYLLEISCSPPSPFPTKQTIVVKQCFQHESGLRKNCSPLVVTMVTIMKNCNFPRYAVSL